MATLSESSEATKEAASIILSQLGGQRALVLMLGAYNFVYGLMDNSDPYLSFKLKAADSINFIKISLNWKDAYDIELGQIKGMTYKVLDTVNDADCDNLIDILEEKTRLFVSRSEICKKVAQ